MCEAAVVENRIVDTVGQLATIVGEEAVVRLGDDPFDDDLRDEYGPRLPRSNDCLCHVDMAATAERAGYFASTAPHDPYHRWLLVRKPPHVTRRALQWLARNVWIFVLVLISSALSHCGVATGPSDSGSHGGKLPNWNFDARFDGDPEYLWRDLFDKVDMPRAQWHRS